MGYQSKYIRLLECLDVLTQITLYEACLTSWYKLFSNGESELSDVVSKQDYMSISILALSSSSWQGEIMRDITQLVWGETDATPLQLMTR
jgi:hypothetical protein